MNILVGVVQAAITLVALMLIIGLMAALFMIIYGIATGIDDSLQE
jgi:hypothetical protein